MLYIHVQQVSNPRNAFERRGGRQGEEPCKEAGSGWLRSSLHGDDNDEEDVSY